MAYNLIPCDREQPFLMPPSLDDWLPEGHLARFLCEVVERFDLSSFYGHRRQDGWGRAAYDPKMMVTLMLYSYALGCRSSRQIERRCIEDIASRYICANHRPDHATICRFRADHEEQISELFTSALELCAEAGLVKVGVVALDGTKVAASASLRATRRRKEIEAEVRKMLEEAKATDESEDALYGQARGDELPEELSDPRSRKTHLEDCLRRLKKQRQAALDEERGALADKTSRRRERAKRAKKVRPARDKRQRTLPQAEADLEVAMAQAEAVANYRQELEDKARREGRETMGPKPDLGRALRQAEEEMARAAEREERRGGVMTINTTDPESKVMKSPQGYLQGYNAQAVVTEEQIILAAEVSDNPSDAVSFLPMLRRLEHNLETIGSKSEVGVLLADAGYLSEEALTAPGPTRLIATRKSYKLRKKAKEGGLRMGPPPEGASPVEQMEHRLLTEEGSELYRKRGQIIEPVFGQIKEGRSCRRFMRRGKKAVDSEWKMMATCHNLMKLFAHRNNQAIAPPGT